VLGPIKVKGRKARVRLRCGKANDRCARTALTVTGAGKGRPRPGRGVRIASRKGIRVGKGKTRTVKLKMTRRARKLFGAGKRRGIKRIRARVEVRSAGLKRKTVLRTVKRTGRVR
jgi:hypothetical protein